VEITPGAISILMLKEFALAFSALLPLVNPPESALIIMSLVGPAKPQIYRQLAAKVALSTAIFFIVIELIGDTMLRFFGISLPVVQLGGGLILSSIGWKLLNQDDSTPSPEKNDFPEADYTQLSHRVFYPFTFPVVAGPGCLVVMITLSAEASVPRVLPDIFAHLGILLAVIALCLLVYFALAFGPKLATRISPETTRGVLRIMAFIVFCIGVQIAWNGVHQMLKEVIHPVVAPTIHSGF
jgi:multiple antibiotic resistance protein